MMIPSHWDDIYTAPELRYNVQRYGIYVGESEPRTHLPLSPYHGLLLSHDLAKDLTAHAVAVGVDSLRQLTLMLEQIDGVEFNAGTKVLIVPSAHPWYKKLVSYSHPGYKRIKEIRLFVTLLVVRDTI